MLNVAAEAARKAGLTNVETRVMNAENLELDADSFDAVVCRIALMLFPNPAKALAEMRRVVKPGGKVTVMVYAALEKNPFWEIFHKTVRRLGTIPPPAPDEPWMFALGEPGALEEVYRRGDFLNVSVRAVLIQRRSPSAVAAVGNMKLRSWRAHRLPIAPSRWPAAQMPISNKSNDSFKESTGSVWEY